MKKILVIFFASLLMISIPVFSFDKDGMTFGRVDGFIYGESHIVINDQVFDLALNTKVYDLNGSSVSRTAIKKGQPLFYRAETQNNIRRRIITEIRFIPEERKD